MANAKRGVKVLSLGWLGVRTASSAAISAFYRDILGLELLHRDASSSRFRLNDGTEAHVYAENDSDHVFFGSAPVVGVAIESFATARAAITDAGIEFLYPEPQRQGGRGLATLPSSRWQRLRDHRTG